MKIAVAFASLSGNTLQVATEISEYLQNLPPQQNLPAIEKIDLLDLIDTQVAQLQAYELVFMGGSSYDEAGINPIAEMFFNTAEGAAGAAGEGAAEAAAVGATEIAQTIFKQTKFAVFALGDSSYPEFATSGRVMAEKLVKLGGEIIEPILKLDGQPDAEMLIGVKQWVDGVLGELG